MVDIQQQLQQKPESTTTNDSRSVFERNLEEFVFDHYDECMSFTCCSSPGTTVTRKKRRGELLARRRRLDLDSDEWANASIHALESGEGENQGRFGEANGSDNDYAIWSHDHQLGPQTMRDHDNSSREQSPDLGKVERERERQIVHG